MHSFESTYKSFLGVSVKVVVNVNHLHEVYRYLKEKLALKSEISLWRVIMDLAKETLIGKLNELYAGEWLAVYQYWLGAKLINNSNSTHTIKELEKHAKEELAHAVLLSEAIISLGGIPVISPDRLTSVSCCPYAAPTNPDVLTILQQNLDSEEDAVAKYRAVLPFCDSQEMYNLLVKIRKDEEEHIVDLKKLKTTESKVI